MFSHLNSLLIRTLNMETEQKETMWTNLQTLNWSKWLIGIACFLPVVFMIYFEYQRYGAIYNLCNKDFVAYTNFTQESVCNGHPLSLHFASLGLVNCSRALEKIEDERPNICALRNWYQTSWVNRVLSSLLNVYERATGVLMIMLVIPLFALLAYWIYKSEIEKTNRHALTMEQQGKPLETMQELLSKMPQWNQQSTPNVVYLEDTVKKRGSLGLKRRKSMLAPTPQENSDDE